MSTSKVFFALALVLVIFGFLQAGPVQAQTYRGAINGSVIDPSGAVVPGASVRAIDKATAIEHATTSTSDGQFAFQDLPVGTYSVVVTAQGFPVLKVDDILVTQGAIYTLQAKLTISAQSTTVEVSAAALSLDTTTETQTTLLTGTDLQTLPMDGRDFSQLIEVTPGFAGYAAGGYGSLNGARANQVNWQIDGVDNNDLWHNIPAVNQGGVNGIAGIILPIDSIDQFSVQTQAAPESGRNPGGTVNLALKSGGNDIHGTGYYYIRNEAFAAKSPFTPTKEQNRNYNAGFSAGGPIVKDRLFLFATFEKQRFVIGLPGLGTEPSQAYQSEALALMSSYGVAENPVSASLLSNLWPAYSLNGPATSLNYSSPDPEFGYSYNGLAKIDFKINDKNTLSFHYFVGQGDQVAPVGGTALSESASEVKYYYEVAPIHVSNYALVWNSTFSSRFSNQVLAGVNYFHQLFNDENTSFSLASYGLVLSPGFDLPGAPNLQIAGFDETGLTPPEGREDVTGHLTDVASYTVGRHQFRFGGEFRRGQVQEFYHRHALGTFLFDGSQGPWAADAATPGTLANTDGSNVLALADFMAGEAESGSIALGNPTRLVIVKDINAFAQDAWEVNRKLTVNYGLRWDYNGPLGDDLKDLSVFIPSKGGLVFQGAGISTVYPKDFKNFSPRVGFAFQPLGDTSLVVRAGFGVFFDRPNLNPFLDNRPSNDAPNGLEGNPAGPSPVDTLQVNNYTFQSGVPVFPAGGSVCPTGNGCSQIYNLFSVDQNLRTPYSYSYNFQIEKQLGSSLVWQIGYVGSAAHRLLTTADINQPALSPLGAAITQAQQQPSRPYYSAFPDFGIINQIETDGNSNYNSLQTVLKVREWRHFTSNFAFTWAHALDDMTAYRGTLAQNSYDLRGDYGSSDFDTRTNFTATLDYRLPDAARFRPLLNGWLLSSLVSIHAGQPFTVFASQDTSGTGEQEQRADIIGNPFAGVSHTFQATGVTWFNPAAFADPANGTFGNSPRNGYRGPGYASVDLSVVKNTKITERVSTQFRVELFNLFNRINLAPPNGTDGSGGGLSGDSIGDYNGAPGIGPGEAFSLQLALKLIF
jgi:Carboxypeptidase regulatory-like domain